MKIILFLFILLLSKTIFAKANIIKSGGFAIVEVDEQERDNFKFVIFHNDEAINIECNNGRCYKKIKLDGKKNIFEWKDLKGFPQNKTINNSIEENTYTLKVYDCKNNKEIERGRLIINNEESYLIKNGKVIIHKWFGKEIKIKPQVNGYIDSEISRSVKLGKIDKVCLYPNLTSKNIHIGKCNDVNRAGKDVPESYIFNLGSIEKFTLDYNTASQKDRIIIYQDGEVIFDTDCVGEAKKVEILKDKSMSEIRVDVQPNCFGGKGTVWKFKIICPE